MSVQMPSQTLARDLNFLRQHELIVVEGDELRANFEVMTRFMPPVELMGFDRLNEISAA